jgi:hypothetical protein
MRSIGGYFELELHQGKAYHRSAIKLNLGRSAFEYIIRAKRIKRIFLPFYTCDVIFDTVLKTGIDFDFYHIDEYLEPIFDFTSLNTKDFFLYTNYFGIKDLFVQNLSKRISNLIIDNSQAFFAKPNPCVDTFYSPRKFFGVPDGGYLYTNTLISKKLEQDVSRDRFSHLLIRFEDNPENGYADFKKNERKLTNQGIKTMSKLTNALLENIDYKKIINNRNQNFAFLHEKVKMFNELQFEKAGLIAPMVYPFLTNNANKIKEELISHKVYIPTFWNNKRIKVNSKSIEDYFKTNLIALPIDQRYNIIELKRILNILKINNL